MQKKPASKPKQTQAELRKQLVTASKKLEQFQREQKIEVALDSVRSRALAMRESRELGEVVAVLYQKLQELEFGIDKGAALVMTFTPGSNDHTQWITDASQSYTIPFFIPFTRHSIARDQINARKRGLSFLGKIYNQKEKNEYFKHLFQHTEYKHLPKNVQKLILNSKKFGISIAFERHAALAIPSTVGTLVTSDEKIILKRFAKAFEQCYTRFLDLQKAEAQAREAKIEAALERVRSRSMGMQKSDELKEVIQIVYDQLVQLRIPVEHTGFILDYKNRNDYNSWIADHLGSPSSVIIPYFDAHYYNRFNEAKRKGLDFFAVNLTRKEKNKFYRDLFKHLPGFPEASKNFILKQPALTISTVLLDNVALYIENFSGTPYHDDENAVLMRFGKVFQQAYTRFLDLQKAEAQGREAQIQLALERVRARTMAMQHSRELAEAAQLLYQQFHSLGIKSSTCAYMFIDEEKQLQRGWAVAADGSLLPDFFDFPLTGDAILDQRYTSWKQKQAIHEASLKGQANKRHHQYLVSLQPPEFGKQIVDHLPDEVFFYNANFSHGYLFIVNTEQFTTEEKEIAIRFAKVFEQTYIRFLDLQKAEAQAREAQIQLALERIRARTMAMHRSDELGDAATIMFDQLKKLGVKLWAATFDIWKPGDEFAIEYAAGPDGKFLRPFKNFIDYNLPATKYALAEFEKGNKLIEVVYSDEALKEGNKKFLTQPETKDIFESFLNAGYTFPEFQVNHFAVFSNGYLQFISTERCPEAHEIFLRMANVFDQTYTRFLDLQKAEAQAREAQIETALERVRSRSMGMQRVDDMKAVIKEVYEQLKWLGFKSGVAAINIMDAVTGDMDIWMEGLEDGYDLPERYHVPYFDHPGHNQHLEHWKNGNSYAVIEISGPDKKSYDNYFFFHTDFARVPENTRNLMMSQESFTSSMAYMKYGAIGWAPAMIVKEQTLVLQRFAKVFEQTYTRFLDLQRAEAQAREAQIEAALERVRSRSLAMHHSIELEQVVGSLFDRLLELGLSFDGALIFTFDKEKRNIKLWIATTQLSDPAFIDIPYDEDISNNTIIRDLWAAIENEEVVLSKSYCGEIKNEYFRYIAKYNGTKIPDSIQQIQQQTECWTLHCVAQKNSMVGFDTWSGHSTKDEDFQILKRFAKVFDQAYIRFLDLQKSEAQAREAQIEAALERVRAQTMAMHNSEDVGKCVIKMFAELTALGVDERTRFGIGILNHDNENNQLWTAKKNEEEVKLHIGNLDMTSHPLLISARKAWKEQVPFHKYVLEGEDLVKYYQMLNTAPDYKIQIPIEKLPEKEIQHCFIFEHGFFYAFNSHEFQPGIIQIIQRFTSLFAQTYRRYLDLVKAEAQAREAEIELALERVRARTMAMQHSSELAETSFLLVKQVLGLGIKSWGFAFNIFDTDQPSSTEWFSNDQGYKSTYKIPREGVFLRYYEAAQRGESLHVEEFLGDACVEHYRYLSTLPGLEEEMKMYARDGVPLPTSQYDNVAFFKYGYLLFVTYENVPEAHDIFRRFAKVFEQTYTRFLDLQKAEAQAREAQIEAALERVRSRSMGMQRGEDLKSVVKELYDQLRLLGFKWGAAAITIMDETTGDIDWWMEGFEDGYDLPEKYKVPYFDHPAHNQQIDLWKAGSKFAAIEISGKEKKTFDNYYFFHTDFSRAPESTKDLMMSQESVIFSMAYIKYGALFWSPTRLDEEQAVIMQRFANVFEQTYTRFLDLQRAEAQAREAQIELGLERVRARAMAMHKSDELSDLVAILFEELTKLDMVLARCIIWIINQETLTARMWMANSEDKLSSESYFIKKLEHPYYKAILEGWQERKTKWVYDLEGDEKRSIDHLLLNETELSRLPDAVKQGILSAIHTSVCGSFSNFGLLETSGPVPLTDEQLDIVSRFAKVFDLTYTRFLDLQKAEAQVREAQIEAALERVRSRSMAMHKSEELLSVITVVSEQLQHLGLKFNTVSFAVNNREHDYKFWFVARGDTNPTFIKVPYISNPMYNRMKDVLASGADFYSDTLTMEESRHWHEHLFAHASLPNLSDDTKAYILRSGYARSIAIMSSIMLVVSNYAARPYSKEENDIIKRIATVFQQSYTRFLDLQRAEAQTREAQIEAALERVRARTMAMHKSSELIETAELLFDQLNLLGAQTQGVAFAICDKESTMVQKWTSIGVFSVPYTYEPGEQRMYEAWKNQLEIYEEVYEGERLKEYYDLFMQIPEFRKGIQKFIDSGYPIPTWQKNHALPFKYGYLLLITTKPFEETQIFIRFAKVFEQTYTRFLDLQKAEAQAKEAIKQSSLDRVRGEIASMRTTADLDRITPLIWRELTTLSIPFSRCGVFIMDEAENQIHTFLSTPDGDAIAAFKLPMDNPGNLEGTVEHWRHHQVFVTHWVDQDFQAQADLLVQLGAITSRKQYLSKVPDGGIYLHLLPFMHGMLYVGNTAPLSEDELNLVQSLADAFSVAYARYEDFRQLELAKKEVDKAFTELKQAQQQLVQSEKMASLGELTAGIAHEIQNPLNFVNNFSEVSNELIKEIQDLRQKTHEVNQDTEEDMLLKDIASNLEKINFHGKRADAIVKSMLQHSRTSSGKKELTDINVLCDEYLRLAYHGYRAKDKTFNAKFESQLDPSLPKVNVMAQDIGRVVLNLINNAFYVVNEKARLQAEGFMPQVTVVTRKLDSTIEISVKDNGNGIPDSIKEKIFQPFFTTKPTGQGTGLGLSLAYDIVTKGHGGELKVETEEGKGTAFIINLPMAV